MKVVFSWALVLLLSASPALAEEVDDVCAAGKWRFDGLNAAVKDEEAVFREAWLPLLQQVAQCAVRKEHDQSCFEVQGQWDETKFSKQAIDIFGSTEAVQASRADARSRRIAKALQDLGVPAEQIKQTHPPTEPTFRGVELTLVPKCLTTQAKIQEMVQQAVETSVSSEVEEKTAAVVSRVSAMEEKLDAPAPASTPKRRHHLYAGAALGVTSTLFQPNSGVGGALYLSVGYATQPVHVRLALDLGVGSQATQRTHIGVLGSAHWIFADWMQVGLGAGWRVTSYSPSVPWYEQHFSVGIDAQHCFYRFADSGELCVSEFLAPVGARMRRAEYDSTQTLVRINDSTEWLLRFDVAITVRKDFL